SAMPIEQRTAQFDITLTMADAGEQFRGVLNYDRALFEPETILCMRRHFTTLLDAIVAAPRTRIRDLPMLDYAEREDLLRGDAIDVKYEITRCLHESFAERALLVPDSVAASCGVGCLTYAELDA